MKRFYSNIGKRRFDAGRLSVLSSDTRTVVGVALVAILVVAGLYMFQIGSLMPTGGGETHAIQASGSLQELFRNPLLLPFKLPAYILQQLPISDLLAVRLASAAVALASTALFFVIARRWYGNISGSIIAGLFATSGWLLHTGRYGAAIGVLTLTTLALLNLGVWISTTEQSERALIALAAVGALSLYAPGGIWLLAGAMLVCRQAIAEHLRAVSVRTILIASLAATVLAAPLIASLLRNPDIALQWAGLPNELPTLITIAKQAIMSVSAFTVRGPLIPEVWLAHTPLLDVASTILLLVGVMFYSRHLRNARTLLLLAFLTIGIVLVALNGPAALGFLVPIVYLVVGGGLAYFVHQWRKVFPKNPIAKGIGFAMVGIIAFNILLFHTQRYFVAWRYSPDTVQAYKDAAQGSNPTPYLLQ